MATSAPSLGMSMVLLSAKLALVMLAPLLMSLYVARVVAEQGHLVFSGYSIVTLTNTALFIVASSFLQVLYFLGGRALGHGDPQAYRASIRAGLLCAIAMGLATALISAFIGPMLAVLGFDRELVAAALWQGPAAAAGALPMLLLVVYRVHASLIGRANDVAVLAIVGALGGGAAATWIAQWEPAQPAWVAVAVLLALAGANWGVLGAAWLRLRTAGPSPAVRAGGGAALPWKDLWYFGWPIGAVVLMDNAFRLSSTLAMGRWWIDTVPVHSAIVLWLAAGVLVPLGIGQAAVQMVAIANACGDVAQRNRVAMIALKLGGCYGVLGAAALNMFAIPVVNLLLPGADASEESRAMVDSLMLPGGIVLAAEGLLVIAAAVQRGVGLTRALLVQALVGYAVFGTGGQFLFARILGLGAAGLWWGMALGFCVAAFAVTFHCARTFGLGFAPQTPAPSLTRRKETS